VIAPNGYFTKSTAALRIMRQLGGRRRMLYAFILIPQSPRDGVYDLIARYRYQLRGKLTACFAPPTGIPRSVSL
jgi:predicted DCC family thiol-disulfide oxidoreductase YuxK